MPHCARRARSVGRANNSKSTTARSRHISPLLIAAGLAGFVSVALGAFGAHGLEGRLTAEGAEWWATATLYALVHSAAALACALAARQGGSGAAAPGWAFVIGTAIFAGTLYSMAIGAPRWLGAVTPLGGVTLLIGWGLVILLGMRRPPGP